MRTRWVLTVVVLLVATMFTASWLERPPDYGAMPLRQLVQHLTEQAEHNAARFILARRAFETLHPTKRLHEVEQLLSDPDPQVRRAASSTLRFVDLGDGSDLHESDASTRVQFLLQHLDDDEISLTILGMLPNVCDQQRWQQLPAEVTAALRRHLEVRGARPADRAALACVNQFGRIALPLQAELLAIGTAITHSDDAALLTAALAAIAWNNAEVGDPLVQLLASPHGKRHDVVSGAADALARCGPTAAAAVPELLAHIDTPTDEAARRSAILALSAITRDQDVADRCLRVLVRDQADLDTEEPSWTLAASRFAARSRDAALARSVLHTLEAKAQAERKRAEGVATFDAAIALVAAGFGDQKRRDTALAALKDRFTLGSVSHGFDPKGHYRHSVFAGAIELLIDLLLTCPDTAFDLTPVMAQLDHFERAQSTWIRDWAHHQRSRLPR